MKPTFDTITDALKAKGFEQGVTLPFARRGYNGPLHHFFNGPDGEPRVMVTVWPFALRDDDDGIDVFSLTPLGSNLVDVIKEIEKL